jgi:fibronectin-binding autotransporter adhesin
MSNFFGSVHGVGAVSVLGTGTLWNASSSLNVGKAGYGQLTIRDGATVSAREVVLGVSSTGVGVLNIGGEAGSTAVAAGTLTTLDGVTFGAGSGTVNFNHTNNDYVFANTLFGAGTVNVLAGETVFDQAMAYTGVTTIATGATLQLGQGGTVGSIDGDVIDNGTLAFNRSDNVVYTGAVSGGGTLEQNGNGVLTLLGANSQQGTVVNSGTLRAGTDGAFGENGSYTVNAGTLDLNNFDLTAASLAGTGGVVNLGSARLSVDQVGDTTYSGAIFGTGALIKTGQGVPPGVRVVVVSPAF